MDYEYLMIKKDEQAQASSQVESNIKISSIKKVDKEFQMINKKIKTLSKKKKKNGLVFDPRKLIENRDPKSNESYIKIDIKNHYIESNSGDSMAESNKDIEKNISRDTDWTSDDTDVINSNRSKADIERESVKIKLDLKIFRYKNNYNKDKTPNGRDKNVNIIIKNIEEIQDRDIEYKYYHEYSFMIKDLAMMNILILITISYKNQKWKS
ncbi:32386_t:CDS:2 [Gigaspora margarita]|uniref:32386_t:CDS:1 n=1 Tax=Gigaspora margarita TaxID=4874 RepID=A0ABM8VYT8_GIGMA|nr:32386_t:CDS:2 [Gigaspora margarita]